MAMKTGKMKSVGNVDSAFVFRRYSNWKALRRVKTYLRTTMNQACLNSSMTLHIHKDKTDNLPLDTCVNDFVAGNEHRLTLFGTF